MLVRPWQEVNPQIAEMFALGEAGNLLILFIVLGVASIVVLNTMMMVVFSSPGHHNQ